MTGRSLMEQPIGQPQCYPGKVASNIVTAPTYRYNMR